MKVKNLQVISYKFVPLQIEIHVIKSILDQFDCNEFANLIRVYDKFLQ